MVDGSGEDGPLPLAEDFFLTRRAGEPVPVNVSVSRIHTKPDPLGLLVARDVSAAPQGGGGARPLLPALAGLFASRTPTAGS